MSTSNTANTSSITTTAQAGPAVSVQSQLATSTIHGDATHSKSNLDTVINEMSVTREHNAEWVQRENEKISQWGSTSISRVLEQTKLLEDRYVNEAREQQKQIEENHKLELAKAVQALDLAKAAKLKQLEDQLKTNIEKCLGESKQEISRVESEMNQRKLKILEQSTVQDSAVLEKLGTLSIQTKLAPSVTRTVIETNTETGEVVAVAGGQQQAGAGGVQGQQVQSQPAPGGTVTQQGQVITGDMVRDRDQKKVGSGAVVSTQTIVEQPQQSSVQQQPIQQQQQPLQQQARMGHVGNVQRNQHQGHQAPLHAPSAGTGGQHVDAAYGVPLKDPTRDPSLHYNKPSDGDNTTGGTQQGKHEGLLDKVKHAITGERSEPKSTDAHQRV